MANINNITEALDTLRNLANNLPQASVHTQSADTITEGTFSGMVAANAIYQAPTAFLIRNSKLVTIDTNPSNNGEICWIYE